MVEFPVVFPVTEDKFEFEVSKELHLIGVYCIVIFVTCFGSIWSKHTFIGFLCCCYVPCTSFCELEFFLNLLCI
jgi:hypothetical protein